MASGVHLAGDLAINKSDLERKGQSVLTSSEDAVNLARRLAGDRFAGVFCANDRLAEAVLMVCDAGRCRPSVVGIDDAPVAEHLNLTTSANPSLEIVMVAVEIVSRRLAGATGPAAQRIFAPRPGSRGTGTGT